ncbi:MAG TPA: AlpA family phage regulatory protein [Planctomycetes bacterium]|nr:AlpA family phage regulatory protein [Fuerstiella sp.]HIK94756.1 AlpA family phage regulatory protein [Planctomycetota bacterium]
MLTAAEVPANPQFVRDDKGRPIAEDGWPISGLACIDEVIAVSGLSRSKVYQQMAKGDIPSRRFGRSRRVEWAVVRRLFLTSEMQD